MTNILVRILSLCLLLGTVHAQEGPVGEQIRLLKMEIAKAPQNSTLYASLGATYDQLFYEAGNAGNETTAQQYFDQAKQHYLLALEKNPAYFEVAYAMGTLHYNRALAKLNEYNNLDMDFSDAGKKKADTLKREIYEWYEQALPYFKKAESMNPNDVSTLFALKATFEGMDKDELADLFSKRLKLVKDGGTHASAYFIVNAAGVTERNK